MFTTSKKILKDKGAEPTELEDTVAQAFFDLENANQELKSDLKDLYINSAVQIDMPGNRKAVVIHIPYRLRKAYKKIHVRLVRELEKKFSGKANSIGAIGVGRMEKLLGLQAGYAEKEPGRNCWLNLVAGVDGFHVPIANSVAD
ncbi:40S ribosomal protein S7-like [Zingiber officinale]|uniref:40S ribosomal protein S7-like n=1 Tax=Zingiber officinale TaxID=94328 RepID=UPI001C4C406F|nr:40S ribosomal protein S7-like [Zingiber officinale]